MDNHKTLIRHAIDLKNMKCIESFKKEDVIVTTADGKTRQVTKFEYDSEHDGYIIEYR